MTKEIYIASAPRSGNTWLSRLLGDALDSPLLANGRDGLDAPEYFGEGRDGDYLIRKTHDRKRYGTTIFLYRDPRDVAISRFFYRGGLAKTTLKAVINTMHPYDRNARWWYDGQDYDVITSYEGLSSLKLRVAELDRIIHVVTDKWIPYDRLEEVFEYQSIKSIKSRYGNRFAGSVRKGIVGDWKNFFTREHGRLITEKVGELMIEQGYIDDLDWWKEL